PFILLANEFLDALPIRQFVRTDGVWRERLIDLTTAGDALKWTSSASSAADRLYVPPALATGSENQIYEVCPAAHVIIREISRMVMTQKGVALFIDYGYAAQTGGDTFQAVKDHQYADPLAHPGDADLTAHVDFEAVTRLAGHAGVRVSGPVTQGTFLRNLGIEPRADTLMDAASAAQKGDIETALERLTGEDAMGGLFKVIAFSHPDLPDPRGF
ncbi:MAG: SAM-dependent methyltransferase, partial [Rhodospirillales bacterium]|nr:SAM-dependent methyltransferase [Rhodospirillales bacterium]